MKSVFSRVLKRLTIDENMLRAPHSNRINKLTYKRKNFELLRNELLEKHRRSIQAHIDKDVEYLIQDLSPNFFAISDAEITYPSKEDEHKKFTEYLNTQPSSNTKI